MRRIALDVQTLLWVVLMLATLVTWLLGEESSSARALAGAAVIAIGFVKLRLVGIHFMELGRAPIALRAAFEGYVAIVFLTILVLFLAV